MIESTQLEEQLHENAEEFMRTLFESGPDAIMVVNEPGEIVCINSRTESVFGYDRDELVGKPLEILIPDRYRQKYVGQRDSYFAQPEIRQMGTVLPFSGKRKNGDEFPVDIMLSPLRANPGTMVIAVIRDITERTQAEKALCDAEDDFRFLVSRAKDYAILRLDPKGNVVSWNDGAERIKGYKPEEIIGRHFSCFFIEADVQSGKPAKELEEAIATGRYEEEGPRKRKDGTTFWADVIITVLKDESGQVIGFSNVTRDITDRKQAEDAVKHLMHQREDFVATLTHDLKTPVLAANRAVKFLIEGEFGALTDEQVSILQTILQSNEAMYSLVSTLLEVYRYDSGAKQIVIALHDLANATKNLIQELSPLARSSEIKMSVILPNAATPVPCDAAEIRRVVQNLLDNALKFTKPGGEIEVRMDQSGETTTIAVRDTGKGISDEDKPKLFQRFWTPPASGRCYCGTGLGLYLCRKIVELHGGTIWCESMRGVGSTFSFTIRTNNGDKRPELG
ncbi:MAG: PAS domain-containing sensor histidine kinase [Cyanobacteria bacterium]|nr:PAS domain-containing sensor histidine kinase [Cyanobacteriota bacterium]